MPTIEEISTPAFWKAPSLDKLEKVRQELRDIVYVTMGSMHERFYIDISDTFEEKTGVKKPVFETDYHTRILDYLNDHRDLDVIKKIMRLEKLTDADIAELERICWKELGSKEEYEKYINRKEMICGDSVAAFIRSIVGVDRQLAKEKFSQFLDNSPLNVLQDEYINQIIGYVCENGDITPETLFYNEDFANLDWRGVFGPNLPSVGRYVNELHSLIG
jgi:type I restriction enzyme R subunit